MPIRLLVLGALGAVLQACPPPRQLPPPAPSGRCEVNLDELGLFSSVGTGAVAKPVESQSELIGGGYAQGAVGDFLLQNDRLRVIIQRPLRTIGPAPYGGTIIDADLVRPSGQPGRDQLGKVIPLYAWGRTVRATKVEVLAAGSRGGYAAIAATGDDLVLDYVNVQNVITSFLPGVKLVVNPDDPLPLTTTTYYVLSPGESRVRLLSAGCNGGRDPVVMEMGDLVEQGGPTEPFNPTGCTNGVGLNDCLIDPMTWFGYQSDGVAYGYRAYKFAQPTVVAQNALGSIGGTAAVIAEARDQQGLLAWTDASATSRPGSFGILPAKSRTFLRDFFVTRDLSELSSTLLALDGASKARLSLTALQADGTPAPGARIAIVSSTDNKQVTLAVAGADGTVKVDLPPGGYLVSTGEPGRAREAAATVTVPSSGEVSATVRLGASRRLHVSVRDPFNRPLTAKVVVTCGGGSCPAPLVSWRPYLDVEALPDDLAAVAFVGASGDADLPLPPGQYQVFVTRGPEYSAWPDTFPATGRAIDVTTADATLSATLAQVVDTTGWMSADLHVHAVNSPDSSVPNALRVASFAAEGVDVMVSTDHDFVTDYAPIVRDLGLDGAMATMIGCEVTPFDYGHHNVYPITRDPASVNGGAFDWAGGDGPSLRLDQLYAGLRGAWPAAVIQMNHPRGGFGGALNQMKIDTATGVTHALAQTFRQDPNPAATATNTRLFDSTFDAFEVMNGHQANLGVLNDWMTFLSHGWVKTATGVSDTHTTATDVGGYGRTWVKLGVDDAAHFTPAALAAAIRAHKAVVSSGPFITLSARKVVGGAPTGPSVELGDTISLSPAAGDTLELTVDVQAPEWMQFDSVELYTHTTGREALNGEANSNWPDGRILDKRIYSPGGLTPVPVPGLNGFAARRVHVTEKFTVRPTADTWYVAMVRASSACRGTYPMAWTVSCSSGACTHGDPRPQALTNPILVDADGSGAYDDFPLKGQGLTAAPPPKPAPPARVPTNAELTAFLRQVLKHHH